jgi:hypothetical protein
LRAGIPLDEYEINTPLLGFRKTASTCSGWYAPKAAGHWTIEIAFTDTELAHFRKLKVNGVQRSLHPADGQIRFRGASAPDSPLRWELS